MIIDTNIIIACLKAEPAAVHALSEWKQNGKALFISPISTAEVLALPHISDTEIVIIKAFLKNFYSIPFDDTLAEKAAFLRRKYRLEIPDAAVAATAFMHNTPLVTRDQEFKKVKELTIIEI